MKKLAYPILVIGVILFQISCKKEKVNQAPVVKSILSNPVTSSQLKLPAGNNITLTVIATDPEKDPLTYTWICTTC